MAELEDRRPPPTPASSIPSYDLAYMEVYRDAMYGIIGEDPLLGEIDVVHDRHDGPIRNVRGDTPLDQPMQEASFELSMSIDSVRHTDIEELVADIHKSAKQYIEVQSRGFFAHLSQVSAAAGTTLENVGHGTPTIEQMREMLRRLDLTFDENGMLRGLKIVVAPSQLEAAREIMRQAEEDAECVRIVMEKRAEWLKNRAAYADRALSK